MDESLALTEKYGSWTQLRVMSDNLGAIGNAFYQLLYEGDDFFPSRVLFNSISLEKFLDTKEAVPLFENYIITVGDIVNITPPAISPYPFEEFVAYIDEVSENGGTALGRILRPSNIPICPERPTIRTNFIFERSASDYKKNNPPWAILHTIVGLEVRYNVELDENTSIVVLTEADKCEIKQYLRSPYAHGSFIFNPITHAICFRKIPYQGVLQDSQTLLSALRLFKKGYVELGLHFHFSEGSRGNSLEDKPSYINPYPKIVLNAENLVEFKEWVAKYSSFSIEPGSIVARAIGRLQRTFSGELYDRITDAVIGIETLISPNKESEINYRVAQRLGFMLSNDPKDRIKFAKEMKEAYGVRSKVVHAGVTDGEENEKTAQDCQEYLRICIKKILEADKSLMEAFCRRKKGKNPTSVREDKFYDYLIFFGGDFNTAIQYWCSVKE